MAIVTRGLARNLIATRLSLKHHVALQRLMYSHDHVSELYGLVLLSL